MASCAVKVRRVVANLSVLGAFDQLKKEIYSLERILLRITDWVYHFDETINYLYSTCPEGHSHACI